MKASWAGRAGFSLLELLVATACTTLIAGAVFSLFVGSAGASRRAWNGLAARRVADAAVAALVEDLRHAGMGLEAAAAVQVGGERVPSAASVPDGVLRVVRARGAAVEVRQAGPGSRFVVDSTAMRAGDKVAAVGFADRPSAAPLPLGVVTAVVPSGTWVELFIAWRAAEAATVAAWGTPRALLPVEIRQYGLRAFDGALQLTRRTNDGARQPVADGLEALHVTWLVDTDGDHRADAQRDELPAASSSVRACAVRVVARVAALRARLRGPTAAAGAPVQIATRWVTLGGC